MHVALPGSPIYIEAKKIINTFQNIMNMKNLHFCYEHIPLSTKYCSSSEVLSFRDKAWEKYFSNPTYLDFLERRLGNIAKENVIKMSKVKLKRKILEESFRTN